VLVVTRRRAEAIMIGDGIEVRVVRIDKDHVRLGITAPAEVAVHRQEVYEEIRRENETASTVLGTSLQRLEPRSS
jgi:carbon storage regulator